MDWTQQAAYVDDGAAHDHDDSGSGWDDSSSDDEGGRAPPPTAADAPATPESPENTVKQPNDSPPGAKKEKKSKSKNDGSSAASPAAKASPELQPKKKSKKSPSKTKSPAADPGSDDEPSSKGKKKKKAAKKGKKGKKAAESDEDSGPPKELRSPICVIMGHVDTGKTKILDKIRKTNVQGKEAGGITQQIGASFFPREHLVAQTAELNAAMGGKLTFDVPGLLIIDTPGHESFSNLRSRGSSLCDIAILVIDIMHGLEPQTIESLKMLRERRAPFIIALNKIDRLNGWDSTPDAPFPVTFKKQKSRTKEHFEELVNRVLVGLGREHDLDANLYYRLKKKDYKQTIAIVPTSAHSGEGLPDLMAVLVQLTQNFLSSRIAFNEGLSCTVLEVKKTQTHGTTLDVILSNGFLRKNDRIVVCGMQGPIVARIRALLTPASLTEMRTKGEYESLEEVKASRGIRISVTHPHDLEHAVAGSQIVVAGPGADLEAIKDAVQEDLQDLMSRISHQGTGVFVVSSTLGSLEALLEFLRSMKIPVVGFAVGDVYKKHVFQAATMRERGHPEFAVILAFNVHVDPVAAEEARKENVTIFTAEIIYHLFDRFRIHWDEVKKRMRENSKAPVSFPCILEILPDFIIHNRNPIILGVRVKEGKLRRGNPLCALIPQASTAADDGSGSGGGTAHILLGNVSSIESEGKEVDSGIAAAGEEVAIKLEGGDVNIAYGRHFTAANPLCSVHSRQSIDHLKAHFADELEKNDWRLLVRLKPYFDII